MDGRRGKQGQTDIPRASQTVRIIYLISDLHFTRGNILCDSETYLKVLLQYNKTFKTIKKEVTTMKEKN